MKNFLTLEFIEAITIYTLDLVKARLRYQIQYLPDKPKENASSATPQLTTVRKTLYCVKS